MGGRNLIAMLAVSLAVAAPAGNPVAEIVALVRSAIEHGQPDQDVAKALHKMRPSESLDDGIIEDLRIEGAGPRALVELERLHDASHGLPKPAALSAARGMPPSAQEQSRVWEAARENSLSYVKSLPDFICTETVRRYRDPKGHDDWRLTDTLLLKLTYFEQKEDYKLISENGRPTMRSYEETGGAVTKGEFGSRLSQIFELASKTVFQWTRWTNLRGRPTHVYFFRVSIFDAPYRMDFGTSWGGRASALVGEHGYLYIDRDSNMVVRIASEADSIPPKFPVQKATTLLDYDFTDVGGRRYLLPLRAEIHLGTGLLSHKNEVEFRGYQKFSSDATISFDK